MIKQVTLWLCLTILAAAPTLAQTDPAQEIDDADRIFGSVRKAMRAIPQSTLQGWASIGVVLNKLDSFAHDPSLDRALRTRADYVRAYGYHVIGLYDVSVDIYRKALSSNPSNEMRADLLRDLANSLEKMGEFRDAVGCRKEVLQFDKPKKTDHNNLALVALKAGDYLTAIKEVNELDSTDPDGAEARVWSARAYAYQGLYTEAEGELAIACRNRIEDACVRLRGVRESGVPKSWWRVDRTERERLWSSTTRIPDSCGLLRNELDGWSISHFAGSSWFNELTQFYSSTGSISMPTGLRAGYAIIKGYPVIVIQPGLGFEVGFDAMVASYVSSIHGPSAFGGKLPFEVKNRALICENGSTRLFALIVHSDLQEDAIRSAMTNSLIIKEIP